MRIAEVAGVLIPENKGSFTVIRKGLRGEGLRSPVPAKAEAKGKTKTMRGGRNGDFVAVESDAEREFQKAA